MFTDKHIDCKGLDNVEIACDTTINKTGFGFYLSEIKTIIVSFGEKIVSILCNSIRATSYHPANKTLLSISADKFPLFETVETGIYMEIEREDIWPPVYRIRFEDFEIKVVSKTGVLKLSKFSNELTEHSNELTFHKELTL